MDTGLSLIELLRPTIFFGLLVAVSMLESWRPLRLSDPMRLLRWPSNFGLVTLNSLLLLAIPAGLLAVSVWAQRAEFGVLHHVDAPQWIEVALAWLALDLVMYLQHRALHEIRWLWPLHRVHHSDVEFDVTTGLRFHPAEVLLSQLIKAAAILLLGAPWLAVLLMEVGLACFALLTHANLRLGPAFERMLRTLLVTPDMHRIHHSVHRDETDSNYGNVLSLWDHLLRSYRHASRDPPRDMCIGLSTFRVPPAQTLSSLLAQPLQR